MPNYKVAHTWCYTAIRYNSYSFFFPRFCKKEETTDNSKPKIKAQKKPSILIPETKLSVNKIIITFITKRNNPKVIMVSGRVKIISSGLTMAFKKASTKAKIIAVENELITTCGSKSFDNRYTAIAVRSKLVRNFMYIIF